MRRIKQGALALGVFAVLLVLAHFAMPVDDHSKVVNLSQQMAQRSIEKESDARRDQRTRSSQSSLHDQRCTYPSWLNQVFNPDIGSCPWDGQEVITSSNLNQQCLWTSFKDRGKEARMCVHPSDADFISRRVVHVGRFPHCDGLAPMWHKQLNHSFGDNSFGDNKEVYLELGGNIGTCVMHMLAHTNARLVVFEPNPKNLFCITSTLLGLDAGVRQRVALFPFALGDLTVNDALINAAVGNLGNSAIGASVQDNSKQTFHPPEHIQIKALDSLNVANHLDIPLMKMDIQGFECKAIAGMPQTLSKVRNVFTEVAPRWLQAQNCSGSELVNMLEDTGFSVSASQPKDVAREQYNIQATRLNRT